MKFLKKAFKKVFKPIKKFAKSKLGKAALVVGATFFTAGLGTVGFGAFKGAQGVAGILGAVGKTVAAGAQGMLGALGIGNGLSANLAGQIEGATEGQTLFGMNLFGGGGTGYQMTSEGGRPSVDMPGYQGNAIEVAQQSNLLRSTTGMFNGMGGLMLARGVMGGVQAYFQNEQWKDQQEMINRRNWFGDRARGGGTGGAPLINLQPGSTGPWQNVPNYSAPSNRQEDPAMVDVPETEVPQVETDPLGANRPRRMFDI